MKDKLTMLRFADWKGAILIGTDWFFAKYAAEFNHIPYCPAITPQLSHRSTQ